MEERVDVARERAACLVARRVQRSLGGELDEVEVRPPCRGRTGERDRHREGEDRVSVSSTAASPIATIDSPSAMITISA